MTFLDKFIKDIMKLIQTSSISCQVVCSTTKNWTTLFTKLCEQLLMPFFDKFRRYHESLNSPHISASSIPMTSSTQTDRKTSWTLRTPAVRLRSEGAVACVNDTPKINIIPGMNKPQITSTSGRWIWRWGAYTPPQLREELREDRLLFLKTLPVPVWLHCLPTGVERNIEVEFWEICVCLLR